MFARVSCAFADNVAHAQRLYDAMSRLWFMPATPVLSNGGTTRGAASPRASSRSSTSRTASRWRADSGRSASAYQTRSAGRRATDRAKGQTELAIARGASAGEPAMLGAA
ncbi:ribonucleotide reductase N-terminal alpha domain-containing protein, partial [Bradyrhizobium ottawaense]|uniref:ribonucleotide reductase N-terminal alpha domain-containing protein n=1 Tax=Bradyrhizobium ottawaense TaxID=931866 RepID=UPI0030C757EF